MSNRNFIRSHECGGQILVGGEVFCDPYEYCERCKAYRYMDDPRRDFPTGTDGDVNQAAWDDGEIRSPDE